MGREYSKFCDDCILRLDSRLKKVSKAEISKLRKNIVKVKPPMVRARVFLGSDQS